MLPLKQPFVTHSTTIHEKPVVILELTDGDGLSGYGELVALPDPFYTEETYFTAKTMIAEVLWPLLHQAFPISHPKELQRVFRHVKRNKMAIAAIESAFWDLYAKQSGQPLYQLLGGTKQNVQAGIAIGQKQRQEDLFHAIQEAIEQGYKRVKLKISKDNDLQLIKAVRERFPSVPLMADANSAYTLEDLQQLKQLDEFNLSMIEQPFAYDDFLDHAVLQAELKTPVCLDESIASMNDLKTAIALQSCRIVNIKIGRVGGLQTAIEMVAFCQEKNIGVWCGGMIESGIGRAHNIAFATLPGVDLPGDLVGSSHYWERDIIAPEITVHNGLVAVSSHFGLGYDLQETVFAQLVKQTETLTV